MASLEESLNRATGWACPRCLRSRFSLILRCDLGAGPCAAVVKCETCGSSYDAEQMPSLGDLIAEARRRAGKHICPFCESSELDVRARCDLSSGECFFEAACLLCRGTHAL